jgi:RNA polymerase sigma-70 factor (ECF subfamily)
MYHIDLLRKEKSGLYKITDESGSTTYNILDTTPSAEDELITEQNLSRLLQFIKIKTTLSKLIQLRISKN